MSSRTSGRSGAEVPNCMQPTCDAYQWMKGKGLREGRTASVRPRPWPIIGPLPSGSIVLPLGNIMTGPTDITVLLWQGYYHSVTYSGRDIITVFAFLPNIVFDGYEKFPYRSTTHKLMAQPTDQCGCVGWRRRPNISKSTIYWSEDYKLGAFNLTTQKPYLRLSACGTSSLRRKRIRSKFQILTGASSNIRRMIRIEFQTVDESRGDFTSAEPRARAFGSCKVWWFDDFPSAVYQRLMPNKVLSR